MIHYPSFDFASPPRTGTAWFVKACALTPLGERSRGTVHLPPIAPATQMQVTQVRHPCDWLASYYTTIQRTYLDVPSVDVFRNLDWSTFPKFVRSYLRSLPGAIGAMFASYQATTYLRLEDQPFALLELLDCCDLTYDRTKIKVMGPANRSQRELPYWDWQLYQQVLEAEQQFVEDFCYGSCFNCHSSPFGKSAFPP